MRNKSQYLLAVAILLGVCAAAWASKAGRPQPVPLKISGDRSTRSNRLIIPKKFLRDVQVTAAGQTDGAQTRTIIAGIVIALAAVSLVFVLVRTKGRSAKVAIVLAAVGLGGYLIGEMASADIAPPQSDVVREWQHVAGDRQRVTVEVTEEGDSIELVLGTYRRRSRPQEPKKAATRSQPRAGK